MDMKPRGMSNLNFRIMLDEIKENQARLDACSKHHFPSWPTDISTHLHLKVDCSKCGGTIDALRAASYARGYAAAGGDPNEIIPGWSF